MICSHLGGGVISRETDGLQSLPHVSRVIELKMWLNSLPVSEFSSSNCPSESIARCFVLMFPDKRPALYAAVCWLTAARIVLSTHGFWLENVLIVTVSVAWSVSVLTKLNATSVNSLTSAELARSMSQSTSSRDACSIASEWEDQRVTSLSPGDWWMILCLYSGVRKMAAWSDLPKAGRERAL